MHYHRTNGGSCVAYFAMRHSASTRHQWFVVGVCVLFLGTSVIGIARADSITDQLIKRLCDRQAAIGHRLPRPLIDPALCTVAPPQPTLLFSAQPTSVTQNATSTLSWDSTNATACVASGGWSGVKGFDGSEVVTVAATTTYSLTCTGVSGMVSASVTVSVVPAPSPEPTVDISANPQGIVAGGTSLLSWNSENATTCTASNAWTGTKPLDGTETVSPTATSTYAIECVGPGGVAQDSVTITVSPAPQDVPDVTFSANPLQVTPGAGSATSTLTWTTVNADFCAASDGWSGTKGVNGSETVQPNATTTYTLACGNESGTTTESVTVNFVPTPTPAPSIDHLVISEVYYDVASSTLGSENSNEWIEIYNPTNNAVNLQGWFVGDASSTDLIDESAVIPAGGYVVVAASSTPTGVPGGVPVIVLNSSIGNGFANGGDGAVLRNAANALVDAVGYGSSVTASPNVAIPGTTDGHAIYRVQLTTDTDTAADWADTATPTPGQ